jgi:hypothetical protein
VHEECDTLHASAPSEVRRALERFIVLGGGLENTQEDAQAIATRCFVGPEELLLRTF